MHLIATNFYGGPEKQIIEHFKILDKRKWSCYLTSFLEGSNPNEILEIARINDISSFSIPMGYPLDFFALFKLIKILKSTKINLLLTHGYKADILGLIAAKIVGIPIIAFSRGDTQDNLKVRFFWKLDHIALRFVNKIIAVSDAQRKKINNLGIGQKNTSVVRNAISVNDYPVYSSIHRSKFRQKLGINDDAIMVVSAGRMSKEKGQIYLINAIDKIYDKIANVYFVFCGDGPDRSKLEEIVSIYKINKICKFVGFRKDLPEFFNAMDIMVLPSLTEGLPNVVLEAFAVRKPVIASNVGGVNEIVIESQNGKLTPPADVECLGKSILELVESSNKREVFGNNGYNLVKNKFTFQKQLNEIEKIYEDIVIKV